MAQSSDRLAESLDLSGNSDAEDVIASSSKDLSSSLMNNRAKILGLLQNCCICTDQKREDENLLLMSLRLRQQDSCIIRLIEEESDINAVNICGKSALHLAVKRPTIIVAQELLKRGANINMQDKNNFTALHYAAMENHEAVCMLLYYEADVNITCDHNLSPLNLALCNNDDDESIETLMSYYGNDDLANHINLFLRDYPESLLMHNPYLFKLIWPHIDRDILINYYPRPFLLTYLCHFSESLECLEMVLQSDVVVDLIEHFDDYVYRHLKEQHMISFISVVFQCTNNIDINNRMAIIYMALSLGTKIDLEDFHNVFEMYEFDAELEALIYAIDFAPDPDSYFSFALLPFILALNKDFSTKTIMKLFERQIEDEYDKQNLTANALKFFSFSRHNKSNLLTVCDKEMYSYDRITETLETIPEFPSLLELSRNQVYLFTLNVYKVVKPYHFQDAVRKLCIPQKLKDIVRFKVPLY